MYYLIFGFLGGVLLGSIITQLIVRHKTGYGYFKIEPYSDEEPDMYKVNVCLTPDQSLLKVNKIWLYKDPSQK